MILKIDKKLCLIVYGCGAFIYSATLRSTLFGLTGLPAPWWLVNLNVFTAIASIILMMFCIWEDMQIEKSSMLLLIAAYTVLVTISNYCSSTGSAETFSYFLLLVSILPGMMILIPSYEDVDFHSLFRLFLKIYDIVFIGIFAVGIIDFILGGRITNIITSYSYNLADASAVQGQSAYRMYTVCGPPLVNGFYGLSMMVLNKIYDNKYHDAPFSKPIIYVISLIAVVLSGSRTAFLLALIFMMCAELIGSWGVGRVLFLVVLLVVFVNTPFFQDTVGHRIEQGIMNQTDDRYKLFVRLMSNDFGSPGILYGGGYNYSRWLTQTSFFRYLNFEYPLLMFLFDYGVIATLLYYIIFLIYPVWKILQNRGFFVCFSYGVIFAYLQTFNGLAQNYDLNLALGFLALFCIQISSDKVMPEVEI